MQKPHLEIFFSCVSQNKRVSENSKEWLQIYEDFKPMVFELLLDP